MLLLLDQELILHVRWEGDQVHEYDPLTPRAARRLIKESLANMTEYRREVGIFTRFITAWAESPQKLSCRGIPQKERHAEQEDEAALENTGATQRHPTPSNPDLGGESPMGIQEELLHE